MSDDNQKRRQPKKPAGVERKPASKASLQPVGGQPLYFPWLGGSFEDFRNVDAFVDHYREVLVDEAIRGYATSGRGLLMCNRLIDEDCVVVVYAIPGPGEDGIRRIYGEAAGVEFETYDVRSEAMVGAFKNPEDDGRNEAWLRKYSRAIPPEPSGTTLPDLLKGFEHLKTQLDLATALAVAGRLKLGQAPDQIRAEVPATAIRSVVEEHPHQLMLQESAAAHVRRAVERELAK